MKKKTITLTLKKATKGTYVYENADYGISFYLPRPMLDDPASAPATISMTLEA